MIFVILMGSLIGVGVSEGHYGFAAFAFSLMVGGYLNALEKGK